MTSIEWTDESLYRLLDAARQAGLSIGVSEHLKVFEIAAYVRQQGLGDDPVRLRQHLSPIVVRSTEQVAVFERCFNEWWLGLGGSADAVGAPEPPPPLEDTALAAVAKEAPQGHFMAAGSVIALVLLAVVAWLWPAPLPDPEFDADVPDAEIRDAGVPDRGRFDAQARDASIAPAPDMGSPASPDLGEAPRDVAVPTLPPRLAAVDTAGAPIANTQIKATDAIYLQGPRGAVQAIAPRDDDEAIAIAVEGDGLRIWWVRTGQSWVLSDAPSGIERLEWSADGEYLAALGSGTLRLWRMGDASPAVSTDNVCGFAFDPSSPRWLIGTRAPDRVTVHSPSTDTATDKTTNEATNKTTTELTVGDQPRALPARCAMKFSADGALAAVGYDKQAVVFDMSSGRARSLFDVPATPQSILLVEDTESMIVFVRTDEGIWLLERSPEARASNSKQFFGNLTSPELVLSNGYNSQYALLVHEQEVSVLSTNDLEEQPLFVNRQIHRAAWFGSAGAAPQVIAELKTGQICTGGVDLVFEPTDCVALKDARWQHTRRRLTRVHPTGVIQITPLPLTAAGQTFREMQAPGFHAAALGDAPTNDTLVTLLPKPNGAQRLLRYWWVITFGLGFAILTLTVSVLLWRQRRRKLVLERRSAPPDQSVATVQLPAPQRDIYQGARFGKLRTALRLRVPHESTQLDAEATVEATLNAAGWFTPVYRQHRRVPVYLALVRREGPRDQSAQRVQSLLDRLRAGGVYVVEYTYRSDLRRCHPKRGGAVKDLADLAGKYADHRLLIFGESGDLCHPLTGRPEPWISQLDAWPERALMTAVEPADWGPQDVALIASGLSVLPATQAGLAGFVTMQAPAAAASTGGAWPRSFIDAPEGWLTRHAPEPDAIERLCDELQAFLDPEGYRWLQALAAHPELRWQITLFLGLRLDADGASVFEEQRLIRLTRLPWLRAGWMPDWLRVRLLSEMSDADEATVRAFLQDLLSMQGDANTGFALELARPEANTPRRWRRLLADLLRSEPVNSPLHDRLFVDFLMGNSPTALQVAAPTGWRRFVWSHGLKALGLTPQAAVVGCALLLGAIVALGWGLRTLDQQYDLPPGYASGPVYSVERTPTRVRSDEAVTGATGIAYCDTGEISVASSVVATTDCGARFETDSVDPGALASSPLFQNATLIRSAPDARTLVTANSRWVYVWDRGQGAPRAAVEHPLKPDETLVGIALSKDGTRLATASATRVIEWQIGDASDPAPSDPDPSDPDPSDPDPANAFVTKGPGLTLKSPRTVIFDGPMARTVPCLEACLKRADCVAATYDERDCKLFSTHAGTKQSVNAKKMVYLRTASPKPPSQNPIARIAEQLVAATREAPFEKTIAGKTYRYAAQDFGARPDRYGQLTAPGNVSYVLNPAADSWKSNIFVGVTLALAELPVPTVPGPNASNTLNFPRDERLAADLARLPGWQEIAHLDHRGSADKTTAISNSRTQAALERMLRQAQPGDVIGVDHPGAPGDDGGNVTIVVSAAEATDPNATLSLAGAMNNAARITRSGLEELGDGKELQFWLVRHDGSAYSGPDPKPASTSTTTVDGVKCDPQSGHCYATIERKMTWPAARAEARQQQYQGRAGHLVVVNDAREQAFLLQALAINGKWNGAYQDTKAAQFSEPKGGWRWGTGEPMRYLNWAPGEPNDAAGNENFAEFWKTGQWNDDPPTRKKGYVVEFPTVPPDELLFEQDTDRPGADFLDFDLASRDPAKCRERCEQDPRCGAFTYAPPRGAWHGPRPHCWLKRGTPAPVRKGGLVSGIVRRP